MDRIRCFLLLPTGETFISLRRYAQSDARCPARTLTGGHDAMTPVDILPELKANSLTQLDFLNDPRWPASCACGYEFIKDDHRQLFNQTIYRRSDNSEEVLWREAGAGAIMDCEWFHDMKERCGEDSHSYLVKLPGGHEWSPDARASNCDSPCATCGKPNHQHRSTPRPDGVCDRFVESRAHKCWCRHGTAPDLTVDKSGHTCGAGGGSILVEGWHGFLRQGWLEQC